MNMSEYNLSLMRTKIKNMKKVKNKIRERNEKKIKKVIFSFNKIADRCGVSFQSIEIQRNFLFSIK
jgi:hypothetical protein